MTRLFFKIFPLLFLLSVGLANAQNGKITGMVVDSASGQFIPEVRVWLTPGSLEIQAPDGSFRFDKLPAGKYHLASWAFGYDTLKTELELAPGEILRLNLALRPHNYTLDEFKVTGSRGEEGELLHLRNVEDMAIYAAKKTELIQIDRLAANLATNNARQVYKGIAGLNIWENDGAGLQLSIGARGLDPNRTSNFNTRQNGYDISADALGYPESYYTPPTQALERIEIVRGAASLQYGPQFGGLLNFVFKKPPEDKPIEVQTENTLASYGFKSSFNRIAGTHNTWKYSAFYLRKQGDGWRPNAGFHQNNAYFSLSKKWNRQLEVAIEHTYMDYLAQQPGGLMDFEFGQNPEQSKRSRNWFDVRWNLSAAHFNYTISDNTKINSRSFYLNARRQALGELGPINRPDPLRDRDLIRGLYKNFGNETRLIHRYTINALPSTLLVGTRYYQGHSMAYQGDANNGSGPDFFFLHPDNLERSEYEFPSKNVSLFAENLFNLTEKLSITPGLRYEYIRTASDGFYKERVFSGGQVIFEQKFEDSDDKRRGFLLGGIGLSFKANDHLEIYGNFSQNYRSINFSDLAVVNPNLIVDSLLSDERGYNADLGWRGKIGNVFRFDASAFYLRYKNRIGIGEIVVPDPVVVEKTVAYRTNIGDAHILGLEAYAELDLLNTDSGPKGRTQLLWFVNASLLHGQYLSGQSFVVGNQVELIPPVSVKTGLTFRYRSLLASYQYSYVHEHYTDATNAEFVVDATRGLVPSYSVHDFSLTWNWRFLQVSTGVNNMLNASYFTRRATAYPGPGIIPAQARSLYLTVGITI